MALMRREPMGELESVRRAMERMFDQMIGGRGLAGLPWLESSQAFMPNVELFTTDEDVVITAELPGMSPDDVQVEITEEAVHLSGEMKKEQEVKEDNYFRSERRYGQFDRWVPLPNRIKENEAKASFKNGVLTIRAPLAEAITKPAAHRLQVEKEEA